MTDRFHLNLTPINNGQNAQSNIIRGNIQNAQSNNRENGTQVSKDNQNGWT